MGGRGEDRRAKSQRSLRATERPDLKKKNHRWGILGKEPTWLNYVSAAPSLWCGEQTGGTQQWEQWEGRLGSDCREKTPATKDQSVGKSNGKKENTILKTEPTGCKHKWDWVQGKRWRMIPHVLTAVSAWTEVCALSQGKLKKRFRQTSKSVFGRKVV